MDFFALFWDFIITDSKFFRVIVRLAKEIPFELNIVFEEKTQAHTLFLSCIQTVEIASAMSEDQLEYTSWLLRDEIINRNSVYIEIYFFKIIGHSTLEWINDYF